MAPRRSTPISPSKRSSTCCRNSTRSTTAEEVKKRYIKAIGKAMLKVMAKMGISTYQSYCGAQIFDAVGLRSSFVKKYFTGTHTQIEGVGLREIAQETVERHKAAFGDVPGARERARRRRRICLPRARRSPRLARQRRSPTCSTPCAATSPDKYRSFAKQINDQSEQLMTHARHVPHPLGGSARPQARAARGGRVRRPTSSSASRPAP